MKSSLFTCCVIVTLCLASCKQEELNNFTTATEQPWEINNTQGKDYFEDKDLWIRFRYLPDMYVGKLAVNNNTINYVFDTDWGENFYIQVFTKKNDETIENAILELIKKEWKNQKECSVVNRWAWWWNEKYSVYSIDLVDSNIHYTQSELSEIEEAENIAKKDGGPFGGEYKRNEIYNRRLIKKCSHYADPLGLSTSKTTPSSFVYNNKNRFMFLPGLYDAPFYDPSSIVLFE